MATKENNITKRIMLAAARCSAVLFRNNVAMAWVGKTVVNRNGRVVLEDARPLHAGLIKGSSDLIGWTEKEIKPEDIGKKIAVFTAIEVKTKTGRATIDQARFIENLRNAGGIAGIARSEDDAESIITDF